MVDAPTPPAVAPAPAAPKAPKVPAGHVLVRITKPGDGKVATGDRGPDGRDVHFQFNQMPTLPLETAQELEARHFVEIQD